MAAEVSLQTPLDANGFNIQNVVPLAATDATTVGVDVTKITESGDKTQLGALFLAAPLDHAHELVDQIDPRELQKNFRILLRAYVEQGFEVPIGLEKEFEESDKYRG